MILSLADILEAIAEFVNKCLGPLGQDGLTGAKAAGYARDVIIQLCATLIIFLVVRFFLWKPITKMLEKKREAIDSELESAKEANQKAAEYEERLKKELESAQYEVKAIIDAAQMDANAHRDEIINEAKAEAKRRIENARLEIDQEIKNKNQEIKYLIVETAFAAASKICEHEIDKNQYLDVVNQILEGATK